jgi:hypothetical protein
MNKNIVKIIDKVDGTKLKDILSKLYKAQDTKGANLDGLKKFKFVISSENTDRHGDIVKQAGIDTDNFMRNPVFLLDHKYTVASIGGIFTKIYQEGNKTIGEGVFSPTEAGELSSKLYELGMLRAVSVGFLAKEYGTKVNDRGETITDYTVIEKSELLEVSGVAVPANPDALAIIEEKGILSKCIAKNLIDFKEVEVKQDENDDTEPENKPEDVETDKNDEVVENEKETPKTELEKKISDLEKKVDVLEKISEKLKAEIDDENDESDEEKDNEKTEEVEKKKLSLNDIIKSAQAVATELSEELHEAKKLRD